jgi:hypothetical protein
MAEVPEWHQRCRERVSKIGEIHWGAVSLGPGRTAAQPDLRSGQNALMKMLTGLVQRCSADKIVPAFILVIWSRSRRGRSNDEA